MKEVIDHLKSGGIVAYPTETVWGLGVDACNDEAVQKLYELKKRQDSKAISILTANVVEARSLVHLNHEMEKFLSLFWPGPLTAVLSHKSTVSESITGGTGQVGLRCSSLRKIRELVEAYPSPVTTTSANISGTPAALSPKDLQWLPEEVLIWGDEELQESRGSTVISMNEKQVKVLREGDLSLDRVQEIAERYHFSFSDS